MTLLDDMLALLPDNTAGDISASDMRTIVTDLYNLAQTKQGLDSDLTTIAGLTPTSDNFMVAAASAWASRTPTQAKTSLALVKADVGLGNVDNTADSAKPVSTAQQTALDLKAPLASPTFTGTVSGVTKAMVGLGNADNTSDANKPVSTAQQTALDLKANLASPTFTGTVSGITAAMVSAQPVDSDLTTIAALTATTDNFMQSKSSAWASRTPTQVATDLASPLQTAGLAPKASPALTGTATAVNLTVSGRLLDTPVALTPGATVSVDASLGNDFTLTAGQSFTLANPTNLVNGQRLLFAIRQDGTGGWVITLGNKFRFGTDITSITLATGANKTSYLGVRYNGTDDKLDVLAFTTGF